jgi:GMP synthase-like glutamine amidotransferase
MKILILDLHRGEDLTEALKISNAIDRYSKTFLSRLFSPEFSYENLKSYDGIVLTGSDDLTIYGDARVKELKNHLLELAKDRSQILGICGGNQILASTFGYSRYVLKYPEFGWRQVHLTDIGKTDPLFNGLGDTFTPFEYHIMAVRCKERSSVLAENESCVQAILYKPNVRGIQFHPEDSPESGLEFLKKTKNFKDMADTLPRPDEYREWIIFQNFVNMI